MHFGEFSKELPIMMPIYVILTRRRVLSLE